MYLHEKGEEKTTVWQQSTKELLATSDFGSWFSPTYNILLGGEKDSKSKTHLVQLLTHTIQYWEDGAKFKYFLAPKIEVATNMEHYGCVNVPYIRDTSGSVYIIWKRV